MTGDYCVDANSFITSWNTVYPVNVFPSLWPQIAKHQNDIALIAYAKNESKTVVTLEAQQPQKPGKKCNYKIPLVCDEQKVDCISFITMLERLGIEI